LDSGQDIIVSVGKIFLFISVAGWQGCIVPKIRNHNKKYFADGDFFIVLTTFSAAVELCAGITSIELCSNKHTEP